MELPPSNRCSSDCNKEFYNPNVTCDDCGNIISITKKVDKSNKSMPTLKAMPEYFEIGEINIPNHVKMTIGEPILLNPNRFTNLKTILDQLDENATENYEGECLSVTTDGPPCCLMKHVLKSQYD